jgi:multiple sugar transport system substrate-binding protein
MRRRDFLWTAGGVAAAASLAACGKSGSSSAGASASGGASGGAITGDVKVTFQQFGSSKIQANFLASTVKQFTAANPQANVKLQPILASENDYYTKLELAMRSPRTAPDVVYEDTFLINSDISAGYLTALDDRLNTWADWSQFKPTAKGAAKALDGKTYGVPDGTDVRAIWYNKKIFAQAGLPTTWQPKSWADIMTAAQTIKDKVPGVIPLNIYSGTGVGEAASMQGLEMFLYGTPKGTLFDKTSQKWVINSAGFTDALTFIQQVFANGLGPTAQQALGPTWGNTVQQEMLPKGKLAIDLDGSWLSGTWLPSGAAPWPEWHSTLGNAYMPTQNGEGSGKITMSGGWTWAIPKNAQNPNAAWELIKMLTSKAGELTYDINAVQIPVRSDVAADPKYVKANPTNAFFSDLVTDTIYRPAYSEYSKISLVIQQATEKVMTNTATPQVASKFYSDGVTQIVTAAKTTTI